MFMFIIHVYTYSLALSCVDTSQSSLEDEGYDPHTGLRVSIYLTFLFLIFFTCALSFDFKVIYA